MTDDRNQEVQEAWDRFGKYMEDWAGYSGRVTERQRQLWSSIAKNLTGGAYSADNAMRDAVLTVAVMQRNAEDGWKLLTGAPSGDRTVSVLPTAFMFFDVEDAGPDPLADPLTIPVPEIAVPPEIDRDDLPRKAHIALNGTSIRGAAVSGAATADPSVEGVEALQKALRAQYDTVKGVYRLEMVAVEPPGLVRGVYDGLVYLTQPAAIPLANVRIIVGEPPEV